MRLRQLAQKRWRRWLWVPAFAGNDNNKNAPVSRSVSYSAKDGALRGGFLGGAVDHLRSLSGRSDRNAAGFLGLGNLADQIDVEQTVLERGIFHHHEIGKLERPFEGARRDAAIQHFGLVLGVFIG